MALGTRISSIIKHLFYALFLFYVGCGSSDSQTGNGDVPSLPDSVNDVATDGSTEDGGPPSSEVTTSKDEGSQADVPLSPGGCLFFHGLVHHGTPPNQTDSLRRALQLHYRPEEIVTSTREEHQAIFGDEGKDVTC